MIIVMTAEDHCKFPAKSYQLKQECQTLPSLLKRSELANQIITLQLKLQVQGKDLSAWS